MTERAAAHDEVLELLPWYVNGTLGEAERGRLERHLRDCLPCNAALREERRLSGQLRAQDTLPLGPDHGLNELNARIDGRRRRGDGRHAGADRRGAGARGRGFGIGGPGPLPWLGYGLAAALGGVVVWAWLAVNPDAAPPPAADFVTATTPAADTAGDIDIVFAAAPDAAALAAFAREHDLRHVAGPSEIGRYSFAVSDPAPAAVERLLATLGADARVRFAGRAFIGSEGAADAEADVGSTGESVDGRAAGGAP